MDGYRIFTFNPQGFPDPKAVNRDLHLRGFHSVWMIDPGAKAETGYSVYDSGTANDVWVKTCLLYTSLASLEWNTALLPSAK